MEIDEGALERAGALAAAEDVRVPAEVRIAGAEVAGDAVSIRKVSTPVARRTRRGGAYFEDAEIFQARIRTPDPTAPALARRAMLGPNTEFADVEVVLGAGGGEDGAAAPIMLHSNLTGVVQRSGATELVLTVTGTEAAQGAAAPQHAASPAGAPPPPPAP